MRYTLGTVALFLSVALITSAASSEIYKWTDEQGNVQYTDTPDHQSSERIFIASRPTNNARIQAQQQARRDRQATAATAEQRGPTPDEIRAAARESTERCNMYAERQTLYAQSSRLYREDKKGERVYLDDVEAQAAREKVRQQIDENCHAR